MYQEFHFTKDVILLDVEASDKWALIRNMVDAVASDCESRGQSNVSRDALYDAVADRERENASGLENGLAFPHARMKGFEGVSLCLAIPKTPIDFDAKDGKPAELACLMVVQESRAQLALKVMCQFARLLSDPVQREAMINLKDPEALSEFISQRVEAVDTSVKARDIMRKPLADVYPDTPLQEVSRLMNSLRLDSIAVVEKDATMLGEITCEKLFKLGMPDFFSQLKSVSFIREFDPFERYFAGDTLLRARDVMTKDYAGVLEDATLLEIVFELSVHHHSKVYVLRDGKRIGVIDRTVVLERVINI
jgi:mannitol/fructose-specific phosphotransferase system IIA component (Ntr-type)